MQFQFVLDEVDTPLLDWQVGGQRFAIASQSAPSSQEVMADPVSAPAVASVAHRGHTSRSRGAPATVGTFRVCVTNTPCRARESDLGRRRTLGATRTTLVLLVTTRAVLPATLGTLLASLTAAIINLRLGYTTPIDFILAVSLLTVLVSVISAFAPALYASRLDPAQIMRTP